MVTPAVITSIPFNNPNILYCKSRDGEYKYCIRDVHLAHALFCELLIISNYNYLITLMNGISSIANYMYVGPAKQML
jgi:hypothetical protein